MKCQVLYIYEYKTYSWSSGVEKQRMSLEMIGIDIVFWTLQTFNLVGYDTGDVGENLQSTSTLGKGKMNKKRKTKTSND